MAAADARAAAKGHITETERLFVRHVGPDDLDAFADLFANEEVMEYSSGIKSRAEVKVWMEMQREQNSTKRRGAFAVVCKETGEALGYAGLFFFPNLNGRPETEIGYRLRRQFWGRGFATEAADGVLRYALRTLRLARVVALIDPGNVGSARVASKLGFVKEAEVMCAGYTHPDYLYVYESVRPSYFTVVKPLLERGGPEELERLYPQFNSYCRAHDTYGWTYVHWACLRNELPILKGLLACRGNLKNVSGELEDTVLHCA